MCFLVRFHVIIILISQKKWWYYNTIVSLFIIEIPVDIKMRNNWPLISRLFFVVGLQRMKKAKDQRQSWKSLRASKTVGLRKLIKLFFLSWLVKVQKISCKNVFRLNCLQSRTTLFALDTILRAKVKKFFKSQTILTCFL